VSLRRLMIASLVVCSAGHALAAGGNPDFRIKGDFRTPDNGQWGANESVGNVDFRIQSRFLQVYYGGVNRLDEFKFSVQLDFRDISGFATQFTASPYNTDYDVYINNDFVGRVPMSVTDAGLAELSYDSRHPTPPTLPIPANWPSPIATGSTVRVFFAAATLPHIGDPFPAATPIFTTTLDELFARGDANQDGKVDLLDYNILATTLDPASIFGLHVGPMAGDFTGDNASTLADYDTLVLNWTSSAAVPPAPVPCLASIAQPASTTTCPGGSVAFNATATGSGNFSYQWHRNGINISSLANPSAIASQLTIPSVSAATAGTYTCLVTAACGSVSSAPATLTLGDTYANCDGSVGSPLLSPADFSCFLTKYRAGDAYANCDNSAAAPVLSPADFGCFLTRYRNGCQ
jgi:hypothetical protein